MSDIAPRQRYVEVPLSAGARFVRGFKRLGTVFGVLAFCIGIGFSFVTANQQNQALFNRHIQAVCFLDAQHRGQVAMNQYRPQEVDLSKSGCPGPMYSETIGVILTIASAKPAPLEGFIEPLYIGSIISLACGTAIFALFWLVGWLCAGFTRD